MEAEGRLSRDAGVLRGSRVDMSTLQAREGAWAPRETPVKPEAWPQGLLLPTQSPARRPGTIHLDPSSPQVNGFCGHQGQEAADSFTEKGVRALGD